MNGTPGSKPTFIDSLLDDNFLAWSKLKAFADDNNNVGQMAQFSVRGVKKIEGKVLLSSIFSFSLIVFKKVPLRFPLKVCIVC